MTRKLSALLSLLLTFTFLSGVSGAQAAPAKIDTRYVEGTDKQAFIFNPLVVNKVELNMTEGDLQALRDAPTEYHAATLKMTTPKGVSAVYRVGVRIKGGWGSYVNLDNKAGFKIKMNFSVKGQKFYGIKKFTLTFKSYHRCKWSNPSLFLITLLILACISGTVGFANIDLLPNALAPNSILS
jgi:hypothetical protein